jgi:hypothetical protein
MSNFCQAAALALPGWYTTLAIHNIYTLSS